MLRQASGDQSVSDGVIPGERQIVMRVDRPRLTRTLTSLIPPNLGSIPLIFPSRLVEKRGQLAPNGWH